MAGPDHRPYIEPCAAQCLYYPINALRNIAWNYAKTPLVLSLDIDFQFPTRDTLKNAMQAVKENSPQGSDRVFVFVIKNTKCGDMADFTTCEATDMMLNTHPSQGSTFRVKHRWTGTTKPYKTKYELFYEPYFIGRVDLPRYDERFWYGNDKTSQCYETAAKGAEWWILPDRTVGHLQHWQHPSYKTFAHPLVATKDSLVLFASIIKRSHCAFGQNSDLACSDVAARTNPWWVDGMVSTDFWRLADCPADGKWEIYSKEEYNRRIGEGFVDKTTGKRHAYTFD